MVKALDSTYDAGRRGGSWRKVKPVKTLDLVVLAVEWGSGRRQGWLSNLHLGARDPDGGFVMVGKTFKGMTDELLAWQTEALLERETHREGHTVFVRPELVVEIALDGVQTSRRYPGGVALRFARVRGLPPRQGPRGRRPHHHRAGDAGRVFVGGSLSASVGVRCRRRGGPDGRLLHQRVVGRAWRRGDRSAPGPRHAPVRCGPWRPRACGAWPAGSSRPRPPAAGWRPCGGWACADRSDGRPTSATRSTLARGCSRRLTAVEVVAAVDRLRRGRRRGRSPRVGGGDVLDRLAAAQLALELAHVLLLLGRGHGEHDARRRRPGRCGPSGGRSPCRWPGGSNCSTQATPSTWMPRAATSVATSTCTSPRAERRQGPLALALAAVAVDGLGADAGLPQLLGQAVGAVLGAAEHDGRPRPLDEGGGHRMRSAWLTAQKRWVTSPCSSIECGLVAGGVALVAA